MSDLQKAWAKAKLSTLNAFDEADEAGVEEEEEIQGHGDDDSGSASSASSASSTGTVVPSTGQGLFARPKARAKPLEQIPWTTYFERDLHFKSPTTNVSHHAYLNSPAAPISKSPLFIFHHGAGSSGLSFAVLSSEIRKLLPAAGMLSIDARGHGSTTQESDELDLSLETLTDDLLFVIRATEETMGWENLPPVVLVGHSLGGAVVTNLAKRGDLGASVLGFAVLDVVEGSAMDALQSMITYLSTRPSGFPSLESGIDWHVRSRTLRNSTSARTSVPALLVKDGEGPRAWRWRTDLAATQRFWEGWFSGLSKKFLGARGGKLLLLAGTDRLDTELTIGQMQGKYALQVFPEAGHFIHEDLPDRTAMMLVDFYRRNDRSALVLPPKVSDMLKQGKRV